MGENERLIASLLDELGVRSQVVLATKAGHIPAPTAVGALDGRPEHLKAAVTASRESSASTPSGCGSTTGPIQPSPTRRRSVPSRRCTTPVPCAWSASPTRTPSRSVRHTILGDALVSVQNQFSPAFPLQRSRDRGLRGTRADLPALEPAGRPGRREGPGGAASGLRRDRRRTGRLAQQVAIAWERIAQSPCVVLIPGRSGRRPSATRQPPRASALSAEELARLDAS